MKCLYVLHLLASHWSLLVENPRPEADADSYKANWRGVLIPNDYVEKCRKKFIDDTH